MAFFYITSTGEANVRKSADYLPKMIELAGGTYIFKDLGDEDDAASTLSMQMEEFYAGAKDADYIIYNSTIDGELASVDDLSGQESAVGKIQGCTGWKCVLHHEKPLSVYHGTGNDHIRYSWYADR